MTFTLPITLTVETKYLRKAGDTADDLEGKAEDRADAIRKSLQVWLDMDAQREAFGTVIAERMGAADVDHDCEEFEAAERERLREADALHPKYAA